MAQFDFLQDQDAGALIARLAVEAAQVFAPEEADLADVVTEEYLEEVRTAGALLYPGKSRDLSLGIGEAELWLLVVLPVLTGFVANLMAAFSAWTVHGLRDRLAHDARADAPGSALQPDHVRQWLAPQARLAGLTDAQAEQLATLISASLLAVLLAGQQGGGASLAKRQGSHRPRKIRPSSTYWPCPASRRFSSG